MFDPLNALSAPVAGFVSLMGGDQGFWVLGAFYFGMIGAERLYYALKRPGAYDGPDALNNIVINFIDMGFDAVTEFIAPMVLYVWIYQHARLGWSPPVWAALAMAFVGHEIAYYVDHRLGHRVGLFWAFHQVHHSSEQFNFTVAARGFIIDGNVVLHLCALPLAVLGVPPIVWLGMHGAKSIWGIFNHADFVPKLGVLEEVLATPSNHRAHHGTQPKYIDINYSQVTVILDRLLGTFQKEEERAIIGLVSPGYTGAHPLKAEMAGLIWLRDRMRSADRWQDKLAYLWKPPEWEHDARAFAGSRPALAAAPAR